MRQLFLGISSLSNLDLTGIVIGSNQIADDLIIDLAHGTSAILDCLIQGNSVDGNIVVSTIYIVGQLQIISNRAQNITMSGSGTAFINNIISNNIVGAAITFSGLSAITYLLFLGNWADAIYLPDNADFIASTSNKFVWNHASSWSVDGAGTFTCSGVAGSAETRVVWGNTAGGAVTSGTITMGNITTRNMNTMNNFASGTGLAT